MFVAFAVYWPTRLVAKYFLDTNDELELEAFVFQPLNFVNVQPEQAESDENKWEIGDKQSIFSKKFKPSYLRFSQAQINAFDALLHDVDLLLHQF